MFALCLGTWVVSLLFCRCWRLLSTWRKRKHGKPRCCVCDKRIGKAHRYQTYIFRWFIYFNRGIIWGEGGLEQLISPTPWLSTAEQRPDGGIEKIIGCVRAICSDGNIKANTHTHMNGSHPLRVADKSASKKRFFDVCVFDVGFGLKAKLLLCTHLMADRFLVAAILFHRSFV